ncbi:MAG TPA: hypothetical protein PKY13_06360 [Microthrixaceae bacterium]|nr:hypothetical protein [Microthrixaceae bacterium]
MTVHPPVPTSTQLGVSNTKMLWRGFLRRCPACGGRKTHSSYATLLNECPQCSLKFERIFGHSIGYIGLNTVVTFAVTFVVLLGGSIATQPDIPVVPLLIATLSAAGLLPILFLPSAHTMWTAIDLAVRPLTAGEIDPRFIKVDPVVGSWSGRR